MTGMAFFLAALLPAGAPLAAPERAKECGGPQQMACGRVTQDDLDQVTARGAAAGPASGPT